MKKFFTLISVALMAMSANAQEVWKAAEYDLTQAKEEKLTQGIYGAGTADAPDTSVPGELVTSVITASTANVTMTGLSTPNSLSKKDVEEGKTQVYWELKGKPADDANPNDALVTDACNPKFAQYLMPKGNPGAMHWEFYELNSDGDEVFRAYDKYWNPGDEMPAKGAYWKFETKAAGVLKVAIYGNKNANPTYIVDAATKQPLAPASVNVAIYYQNTGFAYESQKDENGEVIPGSEKYLNEGVMADNYVLQHTNGITQNRPVLGYISFPVEAGKTYYVFNQKSQIGLYGFEFTAGATGGDQPGTDTPAADSKLWDFTKTKTANEVFAADATNWADTNGDGSRWTYQPEASNSPIMVGGVELEDTKGLLFTAKAGKIRLDRDNRLGLNGKDITVTIPGLKAGQTVTVKSQSASSSAPERYITPTNLNVTSGFVAGTEYVEVVNVGTVAADGDVTITSTDGGINLYSIEVTSGSTGIGNIEVVAPQFNGAIYNLAGQKVGEDYKGIVIKNGKKFINK